MELQDALVLEDNTPKLEKIHTPKPGNDEVMTEPVCVGVCGTDLQIIRRQRPDPATILGHEGVARVVQGTAESNGIQIGDLVVFNPVDPTDQNQIIGHNTPGLLQRRYIVSAHAIANNLVVPFPKNIDPILGALVEPLGTVIYGHNLVSSAIDQSKVVIVGAGAIGIMHALYAKAQGYQKVLLVNTSRDRLDWCVQKGIISSEDAFLDSDNLPDEILNATEGTGVDAVYMCTSRPNAHAALKKALQYVKPDGCIDLVGGIKDEDRIPGLPEVQDLNAIRRANFCGIPNVGVVKKTRTDGGKTVYVTGHRGTSQEHFKHAITSLENHGDTFSKVISHVISLEAAVSLFEEISKGPVKQFNDALYVKAVVDMRLQGNIIRNI